MESAKMYAAVVSHHGKPESVYVFPTEAAARGFARDLSVKEEWADKADHHDHDHGHDHDDEDHWLEDWADDNGCDVVAGRAAEA